MCFSPISRTTGARLGWSVDANILTDSKATFTGGVSIGEEDGMVGSGSKRIRLLGVAWRDAVLLLIFLSLELSGSLLTINLGF